ncbi:Multidrug resistance protein [Diplodia intermedia]|uniref:Multidrug resistance protein n=1 Tax=Diplodia intermedia TaxID=856260 RepID=A0ABR3U5F4_9PEZI
MSSFMGAFGSNDGTEQRAGAPMQSFPPPQRREQEIVHERSEATTLATTRSRSQSRGRTPASAKAKEAAEDEKNGSDSDSHSEHERVRQVTSLARQYTNASQYSAIGKNPFTEAEPNSSLDPNGENFNARAWAKALLHLRSRDAEKYPERTAGIAYKNLNVFGHGNATDYQKSVGNVLMDIPGLVNQIMGKGQRRIDILRDFEGLVEAGEMLVVLGPPGSGCSTLLKTISGETHGFNIDKDSYINYQGISAHEMHNYFRGEAIYTAEVDVHFPNMTVGDTLAFAARARAPRNTPGDVDPWTYANHMRDVVMAMYGISHTVNTRVGNDFVRGVSGGERKRVSIAEATLSQAPLQCWDNSTRGLDSANAIEFCKTLRMQTDLMGCTACVAIYQAPQSAYDTFDKVVVLYEGYQIFFGRCGEAKQYFVDMGFDCPDRQTTADFLTSMTSAQERVVRPGWENRVPRTPQEFAARWKESQVRAQLLKDIEEYDKKYTIGGEYLEKFKQSRKAQQSKRQRVKSPYTLSYNGQIKLCLWRGFQRLRGDPSLTITQIFGNTIMALILGSVFYNLPDDASSFYSRGALLFFAVLFNAFGSALEILTLYAQRPIVEKHSRYALYHPSAEAYASMLTDMPYKIGNAICFNLILYFMTNLRREPGAFFFFLLISFILTLVMSMMFRTIASVSRTLSQAMAPAAVLILALVIYTGFVIPTRYMLGWSRWINYLDPISYGFESLMINEFHNRNFTCKPDAFVPSRLIPGYENIGPLNMVCGTTGAQPGQDFVDGDTYINTSYAYYHAHKWRNLGIEFVFMIGLLACYLAATEFISAKKSKGEVLLFRRGHIPATAKTADDVEGAPAGRVPVSEKTDNADAIIQRQTAIFHWEDMCYDIKIKSEDRRILDHVDGWVKPGTLTALMGVSGAGKTTLLDVLATRVTMGVITGDAFVDGRQRDASFQRKTGYVQQQDLHLQTSTVREALNFSALLRQPAHVSREEKLTYVEEVIKLLDMQEYADAVVGVPGEGLNVEQRKRLTIGVELAAKPQLLLFLDEPTSGLDSQTSWAICDLMEKLTKNGQAVLCTIHQPSAMLFQRFDRLLFLAKGGRTVYFGEIGQNSKVLTNYFERNGAPHCPPEANPAEWMLEVIGAAPGSHTEVDWHQAWRNSAEYKSVKDELRRMREELPQKTQPSSGDEKASFREFAAPFGFQLWEVTKRVFEQYWRTPSYIYSKLILVVASGLFVGFSFFKAKNSQQGLQNQMFAIFMLMTIFGNLVQQIMPHFVTQRALYEVRERPSKTYSWKAFMLSQIIVELPWNTLAAVLLFFTWYYPIGLWRNAEGAVTERGALMFLLIWAFLMFTSTFTDMVIAGMEAAEAGGNMANLLFMLTLIFCGVLATKEQLPGFWVFMYYVSPFTYLVSGMLSTAVANSEVTCAANEYLRFDPAGDKTCYEYIEPYTVATGGGYMLNPNATSDCQYCAMSSTNQFLAQVDVYFKDAWRNFGIMWIYCIFNVFAAIFIYWLARVPKKSNKKKKQA